MAKLTKEQTKQHEAACEILKKDNLTFDEKWFVFENWQAGADHMNGNAGAFFTPPYMARDFAIDVGGHKVIDICAGIGVLSFMHYHCKDHGGNPPEITCVEINSDYAEVGEKLLPEATWVVADISETWRELGSFD